MEKNKLHADSRIDEKIVNAQHIYDQNRRCITKLPDCNLTLQTDFTDTSSVTCSRPDCRIKVIDSGLLLPIEIGNKDTNFEYEEEWDIGGIPELLNELDADIENSVKVDLQLNAPNFECDEYLIIPKKDVLRPTAINNSTEWSIVSGNKSGLQRTNHAELGFSEKLILHTSTFAGFSKRGHLIPTVFPPNCLSFNSASKFDSNPKEKVSFSCNMSSQAGNNTSVSTNVGCGVISNVGSSQSGSSSSNNSKSITKMSIDHQATLDKGLKMKIKRTKPGTKSSEAKHEIVKATEQLQNGIAAPAISGCNNRTDDNTSSIPCLNSSTSPPHTNVENSNVQNSTNTSGSKKILGNNGNQMNSNTSSSSTSSSSNINSGNSPSNNSTQSSSLMTKRTSSGHRRDKIKDKSSHSNRTVNEKLFSQNNDKELQEKSVCICIAEDNTNSSCSSNTCIRRNERLSTSSGNNTAVPPGVFIPSADTPISSASTVLLSASTPTSSSPVITHPSTISGRANSPGPPNRDAGCGGNIKISSHIAAQLAAAAASNCNNGSVLTNADINSSSPNVPSQLAKQMPPGTISATVHHTISIPISSNKANMLSSSVNTPITSFSINATTNNLQDESSHSPPAKRAKHTDCKMPVINPDNKETVDICIGTSVGTITEPDCLGPCEPGTSVTLEGIVWHETEGGVLVVNVTWRGKTYVGTLLDCTRHDWAPPRFCDSPTDELDSRTPKGRGKRGRAVTTPDLSNFTETRSSIYFSHPHVHSKLRNGTTKGGRGNSKTSNAIEKNNSGSSISSGNGGSTPSTSPIAFLPPRAEKRKSKDEPSSPTNVDDSSCTSMVNASGIPISISGGGLVTQPQSLINPVTGLNVQISAKKCKTSSPCAISPVLLECPEQDCSKKYKHANGLRYHQSHAHGSAVLLDDDCMADVDEQPITPLNSPVSLAVTTVVSETLTETQPLIVSQSSVSDQSELGSKISDVHTIPLPIVHVENSSEASGELTQHTQADLLHTATTQSTSANVLPTLNISSEPSHQREHSDVSLTDSNDINVSTLSSLELSVHGNTDQTPPAKSGVLRFRQADSKINNMSLLSVQEETKSIRNPQDPILPQSSSPISELVKSRSFLSQISKDSNKTQQLQQNSDSYNDEDIHTSTKASSFVGKPKKNRRSPAPNEYEGDGFNACNIPSRDDVQSPAYSDISDDSAPVIDQQPLEKPPTSKNSDLNKKSSETVLSSGTGCSTNVQTTMSSPLGGYGVYQYYQQQQQYVVQPPTEQQPNKSSSTTNITLPATCTTQQTPNLTELNRKEPILDLITKPSTSSLQLSSPTPHEANKDITQTNIASQQSACGLALTSGTLSSSAPSKSVSHFYAFNYMSPSYPFNVDQNYAPVAISADDGKGSRHGILSPTDHQQSTVLFKDDRGKDVNSPSETVKVLHQQQITSNKSIKSEPISKAENIKADAVNSSPSQVSHIPLHTKDLQGLGVYSNMYQRHPMALSSHQLSREEELRRYYIFSDQQRRQSSTVTNINLINQQNQGCSTQSSHQQYKDDSASLQTQQQIKIKPNAPLSMLGNGGKTTTGTKDSPKQKSEDEIKVIKQEGQKPTMETQGPPPPPTSQYFLHPSYIAQTPFGFDPNHPMYRNVLMPPTSPYNTTPYHMPMPRYHAPEDLSRNTGTKALDVLHHAASQYYTTHKIHELSERALKSPNSGNNNGSNAIKVSVSSPNISTTPHSNINANSNGHHSSITQPTTSTQLSHNLPSQTNAACTNKQEITGQKTHGSVSGVDAAVHNEIQKPQTSSNSTVVPNSVAANASTGIGTDSRSPPPQRHVHTHHHTHVGLGYPMYPAPYGAAVLASQQAAAVAVINPFPSGPTK